MFQSRSIEIDYEINLDSSQLQIGFFRLQICSNGKWKMIKTPSTTLTVLENHFPKFAICWPVGVLDVFPNTCCVPGRVARSHKKPKWGNPANFVHGSLFPKNMIYILYTYVLIMNHFKPLKILKNLNLRASCKNQSKSCPNSRQGIHSWHGRHVSGTTSSCGVTLDSLSQVLLPEFQFLLCSRRPFRIVQKGPTNPSPFHGTYHELTREFGIHIILWQPTFSEKGELCCGLLVHTVLKTQFGSTKRHFLRNRPVDTSATLHTSHPPNPWTCSSGSFIMFLNLPSTDKKHIIFPMKCWKVDSSNFQEICN